MLTKIKFSVPRISSRKPQVFFVKGFKTNLGYNSIVPRACREHNRIFVDFNIDYTVYGLGAYRRILADVLDSARFGDLSKPSIKAKGRIMTIHKWEELVTMLNSDGSGETKTLEKWKKVWSDFKNNTKKKAARIYKSVSGTGGGPATNCKLSDHEQRVLNLIGSDAATGLDLAESGLSQNIDTLPQTVSPPRAVSPLEGVQPPEVVSLPSALTPPQTLGLAVSTSPSTVVVEMIEWEHSGPSSRPHTFIPERTDFHIQSPCQITSPAPTNVRQTTPRRRPRRCRAPHSLLGSPSHARPRVRLTNTEQAAQGFLQSDAEWRAFKIQQHNDNMARQREAERIRLMELELQKKWQALMSKGLELLNKYLSK